MASPKKKKSAAKVVSSNKKSLSTHGLILAALLAILVVAVAGFGLTTLMQKRSANAVGAATCGSGYTLIDSTRVIASGASSKTGPAVLKVYKNSSNTKTCGLLISDGAAYGVRKPMNIYPISKSGTGLAGNSGNFLYYAGPVYGGICASYNGIMTFQNVRYGGNAAGCGGAG